MRDLLRSLILLLVIPIGAVLIGPVLLLAAARGEQRVGPITFAALRGGWSGRLFTGWLGLVLWAAVWGGLAALVWPAVEPTLAALHAAPGAAAPALAPVSVTPLPTPAVTLHDVTEGSLAQITPDLPVPTLVPVSQTAPGLPTPPEGTWTSPSATPSATATASATAVPTGTDTPLPTATSVPSPTNTRVVIVTVVAPSPLPLSTPTPQPTATPSSSPTLLPPPASTPSATPTPWPTPAPPPTATPSSTPAPLPTATPREHPKGAGLPPSPIPAPRELPEGAGPQPPSPASPDATPWPTETQRSSTLTPSPSPTVTASIASAATLTVSPEGTGTSLADQRRLAIAAVETANEMLRLAIERPSATRLAELEQYWTDNALPKARTFAVGMYYRVGKPVTASYVYLVPPTIVHEQSLNRMLVDAIEVWTYKGSILVYTEHFAFHYMLAQRDGRWVIVDYTYRNAPTPAPAPRYG